MKKSIISGILTFTAIFLTITGMNAQKIAVYECKWHEVSNADDEESLINRMQYEEKSKFLFLLTNDDKNLFIDLVLEDKAAIQKIMKFGLTTWFNPEGKLKKKIGILFPVTAEGNNEPSFRRNKDGGDRKEMMMAMMARKNQEMVLIGFGGKGTRQEVDPRIDANFQGNIEMMEGGKLHINLVLPIEKLGLSRVSSLNSALSVGFETGYLDLTGQGAPAGGGGQPGGGEMHGGGSHGGGMPGGGPPQGGNAAEQQQQPGIGELASPSKLWIKQVTLKQKP